MAAHVEWRFPRLKNESSGLLEELLQMVKEYNIFLKKKQK